MDHSPRPASQELLASPPQEPPAPPESPTRAAAAVTAAGGPQPAAPVAAKSETGSPATASVIPLSVRRKIEYAYAWDEDDWWELQPFFEARILELKPDADSLYLKALEIAVCDRDLMHASAHAGRVQKLARGEAVREILKPGYSEMAFGGRSYGKLNSTTDPAALDVHAVSIDGKSYPLSESNDPELETALEQAALAKLKRADLGDKGIKSKAFEMKLDTLHAIQRQQALNQARREQLLESYWRESALSGDVRPNKAAR
jgi:hypothetical protein